MEKFSREINGYRRSEVNAFLSEVIDHTEKALKKIEMQQQEIQNLREKLLHYQNLEKSLNMAYDHNEQMRHDIRKMAQGEAKKIIEEAQRNAEKIVNDSLIRAQKLELKNDQVERNLRIFKKKLRSIVEHQLEIVEEIEILEVE
ncbi:MAG: DivIVA domain-containing protein [bacterium]|nr:DivIVA domain-containing protein [bacterium]